MCVCIHIYYWLQVILVCVLLCWQMVRVIGLFIDTQTSSAPMIHLLQVHKFGDSLDNTSLHWRHRNFDLDDRQFDIVHLNLLKPFLRFIHEGEGGEESSYEHHNGRQVWHQSWSTWGQTRSLRIPWIHLKSSCRWSHTKGLFLESQDPYPDLGEGCDDPEGMRTEEAKCDRFGFVHVGLFGLKKFHKIINRFSYHALVTKPVETDFLTRDFVQTVVEVGGNCAVVESVPFAFVTHWLSIYTPRMLDFWFRPCDNWRVFTVAVPATNIIDLFSSLLDFFL